MKVVNQIGMLQIREWLKRAARTDKPWLTGDLTILQFAIDAENDSDGLLELSAVDCEAGVPSTLLIGREGFDEVLES